MQSIPNISGYLKIPHGFSGSLQLAARSLGSPVGNRTSSKQPASHYPNNNSPSIRKHKKAT
ncbi:hypothetical protein H9Q10_06550 [Eikenella sp. S3360]|uniref:Uncharacterized protein n=1 Tax=Eikenella glucosivorans TaxID=2766967 RepID=A0ABS0NAL8_9NEIS|nr:hypothetical protein [Eikenella glucosivorans]MBH5329328.1 hypothetical protein [Eikenella glucosivorans]